MIRLSVPFRQALSRLTLPVMLMFSLGCVLIGRADQNFSDHLRAGLDDILAPAYMLVSAPIQAAEHGTGEIGHLFSLSEENEQLRAQNAELLQWQEVAMALQAQNDALKASLNFVPTPTPQFSTGEVVADLGGVYARSVLVLVPPANGNPQSLVGAVGDGRARLGGPGGGGGQPLRPRAADQRPQQPHPGGDRRQRRPGADGRHQRPQPVSALLGARSAPRGRGDGAHQRRGRGLSARPAGRCRAL